MSTTGTVHQPIRNWFDQVLDFPRPAGVLLTALAILFIAVCDATIYSRISIGMLYTVPLVFSSLFLNRLQVILLAIGLSFLREHFHPYSWDTDGATRVLYVTISHIAAGLFSGELARNRRLVLSHYEAIRREVVLRQEAEQQLRTLIESSPAAIVMLEPDGRVDLANEAAHRLFGLETGALPGRRIDEYIPMMAELLTEQATGKPYRAAAHCRGRKETGESFLACTWFSTFNTQRGARLAAIITDSSDDLRDLQESSLQSLLRSTRVLVGSVSHEIRNMCAAIGVVHANLGRIPSMSGNEDYQALGTLSQGLTRVATLELQNSTDIEVDAVDIHELLEEFSIVESPAIESAEARLSLRIEPGLPPALGDRHGLLQVLLNLTRNSLRALEECPIKLIELSASLDGDSIQIVHQDSGQGISNAEGLFKPFKSGADSAGLGLFVSRAIVRACGGDLVFDPSSPGCKMVIRLQVQPEDSSASGVASPEIQSSEVHL